MVPTRYLAAIIALLYALGMCAPVHGATSGDNPAPAVKSGKVDINTASQAELEDLPGVGSVTAKKIIAGRPYSSIQGLSEAGLTAHQISQIAPYAKASRSTAAGGREATAAKRAEAAPATPPTHRDAAGAGRKLDLNTATEAQLEELPGVGPALSKRIVENRPYTSVEDLSKAKLPEATRAKIADMVTVRKARTARHEAPATSREEDTSAPKATAQPSTRGAQHKVEPAPQDTSYKSEADIENASDHGQVWLNTESKIYHRSSSPWYGKTKNGKFVTESEAKQEGARESRE